MYSDATGLWGLFASAFISATILPGGSEILVAYMVTQQSASLASIVAVATVGNTLGAFTTYYLGRLAANKPSKPTSKSQKATQLITRYGTWALLLSWLPIIGDALCFAAGWLKLPIAWSATAIITGKAVRYILIAYLGNQVL